MINALKRSVWELLRGDLLPNRKLKKLTFKDEYLFRLTQLGTTY